jgi:tRNA threonylcarbamoyladenosine biosynthesis protein TsaE
MASAELALYLPDEAATARLGAALAQALLAERTAIERKGLNLGLSGDLGAGKTALVRALLRALGETGPVKSPSYTLLEPYAVSRLNFYHFDFYRFAQAGEFASAGFRELFGAGSVCAVEWPEKAADALPPLDVRIELQVRGDGRVARLTAATETGARCLSRVRAQWSPAGAA